MALGEFNKVNPFVVQLRSESSYLDKEMLRAIKVFIILFITYIIYLSLLIFGLKTDIIELILSGTPIIGFSIAIINTLRLSETKEIDTILYGDKYKDIYVNNEHLNDLVGIIHEMRGRMKLILELIIIQNIIYICFIAISLLQIFAKLLY
jgi:hypothetical protein